MKKTILTIFVFIFIASLVKANTECFSENITESFILQDNYHSEKTCFEIVSNDVTFDCNGYTISGPGALVARSDNEKRIGVPPYAGIRAKSGTTNIIIKNCKIKDFNTGIESGSEDSEIKENLITKNKYGVVFSSESKNTEMKYNIISDNVEVGIDIKGTSERELEITDNTVEKNKIGIKQYYCVNPQNRYTTKNIIEYNLIKQNEEGVYLGCLKDETFKHNVFKTNEIAIKAAGLKDYTIKDNQIFGNSQGTGIKVYSSDGLKITENTMKDISTGMVVYSQDQTLTNSEISHNIISGGFGINAYSENNEIFLNSFETRRGMNIKGDNNIIINNSIVKYDQVAGYTILVEGDNNIVEDNCLWKDAVAEGEGNTIYTDCIAVGGLTRIDSYIQNEGAPLTAYLRMKVQVDYFGRWKDYKIISGGAPIIIDGIYSIKDRFNIINPELRKIAKPGRYRLHIILTDSHGNILKDSNGNNLEATQEFSISTHQVAEQGDISFFGSIWDAIRNLFN
ncbi:MAG: right-handed parallel beta-helix repeat-containing protein [Nanoarchaeota archaeon]|nr:right-handed parallel beta-helix repeat-containing protein [Nanoarchaeota archaeon]MBU1445616.1 right-handed parallel beta-helix repeat-containing protein [Nanoarchaeota archaeon]MBU2406922.1 right-handed parallel beta-helix repeat-containing protein [Nanoarchaeota archaeon]MBU2420808.1 right-handed parallel beta-helix repeat-containing protein [Nanoarchaeota archaeon]MBU2475649.1 right-handed parallel beta-helix repeat-containing protein [Nanoarchaeota archaeon]